MAAAGCLQSITEARDKARAPNTRARTHARTHVRARARTHTARFQQVWTLGTRQGTQGLFCIDSPPKLQDSCLRTGACRVGFQSLLVSNCFSCRYRHEKQFRTLLRELPDSCLRSSSRFETDQIALSPDSLRRRIRPCSGWALAALFPFSVVPLFRCFSPPRWSGSTLPPPGPGSRPGPQPAIGGSGAPR